MAEHVYTFQLSRLREIGWSLWNPIGLDVPPEDAYADEYDGYLRQAASQAARGATMEQVATYLDQIVQTRMSIKPDPKRSHQTAEAIAAYVEEALQLAVNRS